MRNVIGSAMVATMALSIFCATLLFGAVRMDYAAPAFAFGFLTAVLWAVKLIGARAVSWKQAPTHWPVLAFLAYATLRYFTSPLEYDSRLELIHIWFYGLVYFAVANNFYHSRDRAVFIGLVGVLAVLQAGYGLWQAASNSEMVFWVLRPEVYTGRASGSYICPNHLAGFLEMAFGLLMGRAAFFHSRRGISERDAVRKVLLIYAALMALAGIVASFSRAGATATLVGLVALLMWGEGRLRAGWQKVAALSAVILLVIAAGFFVPKAWDRFNRIFLVDQTAGGRILWWNATTHLVMDHPVFGTGPGTWQWFHQLYRHPDSQIHPAYAHSDTLHLFSDYGLIGWLIVTGFFGCYFWQVALLTTRKTSSEQRSFAIASSIAVIAILAHSWGDFNLHIPANALLLVTIVGLTAAMDDPRNQFPRLTLGRLSRTTLGVVLILLSAAGTWVATRAACSAWYNSKGDEAKSVLDWPTALGYYQRAIALDANHAEPYLNMGEVYRSLSVWRLAPARRQEREALARKAIGYYEESLAKNPFQTQVLVRLAYVYQLLEDMDNAVKALEQALAVDPKSAFVYLRLGLFYRARGDEDKAVDAFQKAEELNATGDDISRINLEEMRPRTQSDSSVSPP
jgi:tetratricopeptide (TPR) repeat protein